MAVSITEYIEHTNAEIPATYYAYAFPAGNYEDSIMVTFFHGQTGHPNTGMDKVIVQFQIKYKDTSDAEEIAIDIINYYKGRSNYNIPLNDSEYMEIIGTQPLTPQPMNLGVSDTFQNVLIINIEFTVIDNDKALCGE